jgi:recombination protein RecT
MNKNAVGEVRLQLDAMRGQFEAVLPKHIPAERFGRVVLTAVQTNPDLLNVDRRSLWNACMKAAQDGLMPDGRLGALVVYKDKRRGAIAQWLPMIAGIRQKVRNSGEIATWDVHVVHDKDLFEFELGDEPHIVHRPARGERGGIIAAYSVALLKSGERSREVMFADEIHEIRQRSKMPDSGPWITDFGEMCKKTVAKRHAKVLPMSTDLDDLLRREDDDDHDTAAAAPASQGRAARPSTLTDALNMVAGLPNGSDDMVRVARGDGIVSVPRHEAVELGADDLSAYDDDTGEVIDDEPQKEAAK